MQGEYDSEIERLTKQHQNEIAEWNGQLTSEREAHLQIKRSHEEQAHENETRVQQLQAQLETIKYLCMDVKDVPVWYLSGFILPTLCKVA